MEITRPDSSTLLISNLDPFLTELLRQIPLAADPQDDPTAKKRLFSSPAAGEEEKQFVQEWRSYVQPELRHLFQASTETVTKDLENVREEQGQPLSTFQLGVPRAHIDAWLNALNQARLALAARQRFTEKDLEANVELGLESVRDLCLFQIHFYGFLQEVLLRELERENG